TAGGGEGITARERAASRRRPPFPPGHGGRQRAGAHRCGDRGGEGSGIAGGGGVSANAGTLSRAPLSCRTSPPQGGRSAASVRPPILQPRRLAKADATADLPTRGGDVRQDRGG